ncbi:DUF3108 domain-containing protein [Bacteroides thetaiotaomicron]|uniref:DUF3108 domain-containing protein n=1 Tax=Bacteroides thetaiotaomicron TaxID=818 RepID=UPI00189ACD7C|nr:DUF3108 domain-containing protein [Bacteroides thetaiotaomicron]
MKKIILSAFILILFILNINAQCGITNNAFQAGEELTYDVYFKYGLIHKKAGLATLKIKNDTYKSRDAYRMSMIANSTGLAKKIFTLSDTMFCYMSKAIEPLSYTKYAHEGSDHTREFITYDYSSGNVNVHAKLTRNDKLRHDTIITSTQCIYDMMTVIYFARTLDFEQMKKGDSKNSMLINGRSKVEMKINHNGKEQIEGNDGKKYDCIVLTLVINTSAFEDQKEAMKIYITNDENRIPIRINSKLKVGSTYAVIKKISGNKHPLPATTK